MDHYEQAYQHVLQMIDATTPRRKILAYLTVAAEKAAGPDTVSSILLLDKDGLLRNGASSIPNP